MQANARQSQTKHFEVSPNAQDRIKMPGSFWIRMQSIGLSPGAILRSSNLPATVYGGETRLTTVQLFAIWRAVRKLSGDPTIGWKGISRLPSDQYHPTLLAALHARTFRDSIERLARYKKLCGAEEFRLTSRGDEVSLEICWPFAGEEAVPALLLDAVFALVIELGRRGTKTKLNARRIELTREAEPKNGIEKYFGCLVKYGASRDALVLRAADLELPFVTHNEELLQALSPQSENSLNEGPAKQGILDQVRWVLKRLLAGSRPDLVMVAKELGLGERTLQRRITGAGTTFRRLLDETRCDLARHYLGDASAEITEVAFLVGFEDANSFYRAFRSWEGKTPAEWRTANNRRTKR